MVTSLDIQFSHRDHPQFPQMVGLNHDGIANLWLKYDNPLDRDNTQSIHVGVKRDPACTGVGFVSGANALDIDNKVTATGCPAPMNCSATQTAKLDIRF